MASAAAQLVAYRTGSDIATCDPKDPTGACAVPFARNGAIRQFEFSQDGKLVAYVSTEGLSVVDLETDKEIYSFQQKGIIEVSVSPQGSFVCTWERQQKPAPETGNQPHQNLLIHSIRTGEVIARYAHKNQSNWAPQWTDDETMYGRLTSSAEVTFYSTLKPGTFKLRATNIADFSLSPGNNPHVVIFIPESKNGNPAIVKMFSLSNFNVPISNKTFFKADKIKFIWSRLGTGVLVLTSTDVDTTGQSYYGENNLYYMSTAGNWDCRVMLDKEGPIHDVAWSPNSREFAVVYGFIPSKTTLFSYRADPVFEFETAPRNTVVFSPTGRFLAVGGFGNLPGQLDFWDLQAKKKLTSVSCPNSTHITWSPDGRWLLTATLSPRLRVDNGWKIWHYRGVCVAHHEVKELFQVAWRPSNQPPPSLDHWARRDLSPPPKGLATVAVKPKSAGGAYRPPSARNGAARPPVPGAPAPAAPRPTVPGMPMRGGTPAGSPGTRSPVPRRPNSGSPMSNSGIGASSPRPSSNSSNRASPEAPAPVVPLMGEAREKRVHFLVKKLKQIKGLKDKAAAGEKLDAAQQRKIEGEAGIFADLAELGVYNPVI